MITDLEAVLIRNSRVAQANAQAAVYDAYAVANRNARVARENAQAAADARADAAASAAECDRLIDENIRLSVRIDKLQSQNSAALDLLAEAVALLDAHGIEFPAN